MKFSTVDKPEDLKYGDRVIFIDDLHKWQSRQLKVLSREEGFIKCQGYIIDFDSIGDILKLEPEEEDDKRNRS